MRERGNRFEHRAAAWVEARGWKIIARNFRGRTGEIDLIALDAGCLVFIEVRARSHRDFAGAAASVDWRKRRKLLRTAQLFLQKHRQFAGRRCRFDVIAFEPRQSTPGFHLNWIRGAFCA